MLLFVGCISFDSYIKPQLREDRSWEPCGCISFDSYIKPQLRHCRFWRVVSCISFDSYIKPQLHHIFKYRVGVVYLLIPTSNHNVSHFVWLFHTLYIFWFLHQTTTMDFFTPILGGCISFDSYIKPQLHIFRSSCQPGCISFDSYIKPQLHLLAFLFIGSCISFDSYIKPQLG